MTHTKQIRQLGGLLTILVLLGLIVADAVVPEIHLSWDDKALLVALVSGLLGVDIYLQSSAVLTDALAQLGVSVIDLARADVDNRTAALQEDPQDDE